MNKDSPSVGRTKRRAGCMALSDGSEASPDLQEGSCLDVTQYLLLFFIGLRGLTARAVRHCLLFHQGKSE